jgi:hypothetical protein
MIAIMWQFDIKAGNEAEFGKVLRRQRGRTAANRHSRIFPGHVVLARIAGRASDVTLRGRRVLERGWSSTSSTKNYRGDELARLGARRDQLVASCEPLGVFTALDVPDRAGAAWSRRS